MNFEQLREIVKNIKERVVCSGCESNYRGEDIYILSTIADKCIILVNCKHCHTPMLITASVNNTKTGEKTFSNFEKLSFEDGKDKEMISSDDVVEIHNFLKNFDGDFEKLKIEEKRKK